MFMGFMGNGDFIVSDYEVKGAGGEYPSLAATILLRFLEKQRCLRVENAEMEVDEAESHLERVAARAVLEEIKKEGDWFPMPLKEVEEALGFDPQKQARLFKELKSRGLIETKRVGLPSTRWVRRVWEESKKSTSRRKGTKSSR